MTVAYSTLAPASRLAAAAARAAMLALIGCALSGCYTTREVATNDVPNDYRLRHPITIQEKERKVVILVGTNRGTLDAAQRADVLAFAQEWRRRSSGGIVVDVPVGTANQRAAADAVREVESIFLAADVPQRAYNVRPYKPRDTSKLAAIKLAYPTITAEAGPCGLWPADVGPAGEESYFENRPYWNQGCALQQNLAAMVDNPTDLIQPRGESPAYSPRRNQVMDHYRKGESPATTYPNPNQGHISDVGQ